MPAPKEMLQEATKQLDNAYAPYSNCQVGACFRAEDGKLYSGCNIENASYSLTLCAESSALANLITHGNCKITEALICTPAQEPWPPCGACRQRLVEFAEADTLIHLCSTQGKQLTITLGELMPLSFNAKNLETS